MQTITSIVWQEGRYSTAHVYKHAIRSFSQFCGTQSITFSRINRETLKRYSNYLLASRLKPNTISTYMRMLRSIYNRGVDTHQAPYVHGLFRDVFTGVDTRQKKAIPIGELHILLNKDPQSESFAGHRPLPICYFSFVECFFWFGPSGKIQFETRSFKVQPSQDRYSYEYRSAGVSAQCNRGIIQ